MCSETVTHVQTRKLNGTSYVVCITSQFENLGIIHPKDGSGQAVWNHGSLEWSVSGQELRGIDLLSPSHFHFLIGQSSPKFNKALNPLNFQIVSSVSSCRDSQVDICGGAPPLSTDMVLQISPALCRSGSWLGGTWSPALETQEAEMEGGVKRWGMSGTKGTLLSK